jgi:hypothetical protein
VSDIALLARELHHFARIGLSPEEILHRVRESWPEMSPDDVRRAVDINIELLDVEIVEQRAAGSRGIA